MALDAISPKTPPQASKRCGTELDPPTDANGLVGQPEYLDAFDDTEAYRSWIASGVTASVPTLTETINRSASSRGPRHKRSTRHADRGICFSLLMVGEDRGGDCASRTVASLQAQTHTAWELLPCISSAPELQMIERRGAGSNAEPGADPAVWGELDRRVRLPAPPAKRWHLREALAEASGQLLGLVGEGDVIEPNALELIEAAFKDDFEVDVVYTDEDEIDDDLLRLHPRFKPGWSPELLLSSPYLGRLLVARRALLENASAFDDEKETVDLEYDLMLRCAEKANRIVHLPFALYHRRLDDTEPARILSQAQARRKAVKKAIERRRLPASVQPGPSPGDWSVRFAAPDHVSVSVIVAFRDQAATVRGCVESLEPLMQRHHLEVVLVDNGSRDPEAVAVARQLARLRGVRVLFHPGRFNWAAINNAAAATCRSDLLLFMNDDVEARDETWLSALIEHAWRDEVGAVGARLLYPDGTVQHAGMVLGMDILAGHVLAGLPGQRDGYLGWAKHVRECSAVTGACMMTRRELFERLGGFDEDLAVALNDVDYCLRLRDAGYTIIYTPHAELVHHESRSRGSGGFYDDCRRFLERWGDAIRSGDPFFNPNLSRFDLRCVLKPHEEDAKWERRFKELTSS